MCVTRVLSLRLPSPSILLPGRLSKQPMTPSRFMGRMAAAANIKFKDICETPRLWRSSKEVRRCNKSILPGTPARKRCPMDQQPVKQKAIKCVVWDLDQTLWEGVLLEDDRISLRSNVPDIIKTLDSRGIVQSIASKNDPEKALETLHELGLAEYFLHPQINWNAKSSSIKDIARLINIGVDTIAFIDDQPFERAEVNYTLP